MARKSVHLVEDEVLLHWLVEDALRGCGNDVLTLTSGTEGLAAIESGRRFDALVTNIRLEDGPDGWSLARRARERNPEIAVLYVSGDSAAAHGEQGVDGSRMIAKPFEPDRLCGTLDPLMCSCAKEG